MNIISTLDLIYEEKNMNKEYIFITGPSESGKSGAAEYIERIFDSVKHLKMRDIISMADSKVDDSTEQFWNEYINVAIKMSEGKSIIVMDTLRKPESAVILNRLLKDRMHILYIDANLKNRVIREYTKLIKEGKSISLKYVLKRTIEKDKEKEKFGLEGIKELIKDKKGKIQLQERDKICSCIIDNNGSLSELHRKLEEFINEIERRNKEVIER